MLAALAADVREDRKHLERETALDVRQVHDGVLEVVQDEDEEDAEHEGKRDAEPEDDERIREDRLLGLGRLASCQDALVAGLRLAAELDLGVEVALVEVLGDLEVALELGEAGLGKDDLLLVGREVRAHHVALLPEGRKPVAGRLEVGDARLEGARRRVQEALLRKLHLLGLRHHLLVGGLVDDEERRMLASRLLVGVVLRRDLLCARGAGGEGAELLRILLDVAQDLLPLLELRHFAFKGEDVARRPRDGLLERVAVGPEDVDAVVDAEVGYRLAQLVALAVLLLDVRVGVAHLVLDALLVLLVRMLADRLDVGVREVLGELRVLGCRRSS